MLQGFGWCVLRSSREPYCAATVDNVDAIDSKVGGADQALWAAFLDWMAEQRLDAEPIRWTFFEQLNWARGILQFTVACNHRGSTAWDMLRWIAENGAGSYGLFYVHDDEDQRGVTHYDRGSDDFSNEFRVHRIANGKITEHADPFLSPIYPLIDPSNLG